MMGDSIAEVNAPPIISSSDCHSVKESLVDEFANGIQHEENKDEAPEVLNKDGQCKVVPEKVLNQLVKGLLSCYVDDLKKTSTSLNELTRNQDVVIETLQQENNRFVETLRIYNLDDIFSRAKLYTSKLQQIKKEMSALHERSIKLKKRALRLQQQKQKEALTKEQQREEELERDKQLAPKVATKS